MKTTCTTALWHYRTCLIQYTIQNSTQIFKYSAPVIDGFKRSYPSIKIVQAFLPECFRYDIISASSHIDSSIHVKHAQLISNVSQSPGNSD